MSDAERPVIGLLRSGGPFLVFLHVDPDGDALGSALALTSALRRAGRQASLFMPRDVFLPSRYAEWCDPALCTSELPPGGFDALVLDCASQARALGQEALDSARRVVNVDHHLDNPGYGDLVLVEPEAASVGIIVLRLMEGLGLQPEGPEVELLYLSIMTDTGRFAYANTNAEALSRAAGLVELGADPASLARRYYETNSLASVRLIGRAIKKMELMDDGRMVFSALEEVDFRDCGASYDDSEDVINVLRTVAGTDLTVLAKEKDGLFKVSLRSVAPTTCGPLASRFGGGGHALAAGYTYRGTLEEVRSSLLEAVAEMR